VTRAPDPVTVIDLIRRLLAEVGRDGATAIAVANAAGGEVVDSGAPLAAEARPDVPGVGAVTVTRRWNSETPNSAMFALAPGLAPAALEAELGPAIPVPGTGAERVVMLGDGAGPATALVGVDDDGDARSVTVRRELGP
jgi:hypothetical protein